MGDQTDQRAEDSSQANLGVMKQREIVDGWSVVLAPSVQQPGTNHPHPHPCSRSRTLRRLWTEFEVMDAPCVGPASDLGFVQVTHSRPVLGKVSRGHSTGHG